MTECDARQLVAELQARGYKAAVYFEALVDGQPEQWRVIAYGRKVERTERKKKLDTESARMAPHPHISGWGSMG